jgi:hypothetical protein
MIVWSTQALSDQTRIKKDERYKWVVGLYGALKKWSRSLRLWMQSQRLPVCRTRVADLVDLVSSPSKFGTNNSIPTNS